MKDPDLRAYLLGRMEPDEAAHLEGRLLDDQELFDAARGVEDELFDEFARGRLEGDLRRRFLERYGEQADRIAFAQGFARRSGDAAAVVPFRTRRRPIWIPVAAAATIVLAVAGIRLARPTPRDDAAAVVAPAPAAAAATPVVALVTLGTSRSASTGAIVTLSQHASALELHVAIDPADRFDRYAIELRSGANAMVWRDDRARISNDGGQLTLVASVPAAALAAGSYDLAVRGESGATVDDLGFVAVTVRREP